MMMLTAPLKYYKYKKQIDLMHNFTDRVIAERKVKLEASIKNGTNAVNGKFD